MIRGSDECQGAHSNSPNRIADASGYLTRAARDGILVCSIRSTICQDRIGEVSSCPRHQIY